LKTELHLTPDSTEIPTRGFGQSAQQRKSEKKKIIFWGLIGIQIYIPASTASYRA
jgi:hypothetical protein